MIDITDKEFTMLVQYIKNNYGVNLQRKRILVVGRLQQYLLQQGYASFGEYLQAVKNDRSGHEGMVLINKLTTNHTYFAREPAHFDFFQTNILPVLKQTEQQDKDLRIWSAGCSSGEESYMLAMLLSDFFGLEKPGWDTKILATDISTHVLEMAVEGVYSPEQIAGLPVGMRLKYFRKIDEQYYVVKDCIKDEVIFRRFNLMNPRFPFKKKFHVIFCRNVMIYFDAKTKRELVNRFYEATEEGGYLFIGQSESLQHGEAPYQYIMPAVYRKE